jgi:predicted nucleic acid-binding protein
VTPIVDTGPLVALLDRSDRHHDWAVEVFSRLRTGLVTCESVIAETLFLCSRNRVDARAIHTLIENQSLRVLPTFDTPAKVVQLLRRYASVPMSVADAGLVLLHDTITPSVVITCDSDFRTYRRSRGRHIDALVPDGI